MDPITAFAGLSLGSTVLGGASSAKGAKEAAAAQEEAARYQQGVALYNKQVAEQMAQAELEKGKVDVQSQRMKNAQIYGETLAAQGASGLDVAGGSATRVRESERLIGEFDAAQIAANAEKSAYALRQRGVDFGNEANLFDLQARSARKAGKTNFMSSLLGTASSVSDKWLKFQGAGVFG